MKRRTVIRRLLGLVILAVLLWLFFILGGRALCYIAMQQIAGLTNTEIRTESVDFHTDGSVFITKLVVSPSEEQNGNDTILKAEEVFARFSLSSLLKLSPRLKVIDVNDFVFNAQYDLDYDRWNLSGLKVETTKSRPGRMPRIRLNSGTFRYTKTSRGKVEVGVSLPIDARFGLNEEKDQGYGFEIITADMASGFAQSRLEGFWKPGSITMTGGIASVDVPEFDMAWIIDVMAAELTYDQSNAFSLKLKVTDLYSRRSPVPDELALDESYSAKKKSSPFAALQRFFDRYQPRGRIDVDLDVSGNLNRPGESTLAGKVLCKDIAICYYKFKYAIEELAGQIELTTNRVELNNLSGKHGDVKLLFNGWSEDFGPDWKYDIRITSDNMPLDDDLYNALSHRQQEFWSTFSPAGSAAIDYRFSQSSPTDKHKKLTVEPRGAEAVYCDLPYPLKNLTGRLSFDSNKVVLSNVVSQVKERKITLNGEVENRSTDKPRYDISAKLDNIPLDLTLEEALPEKQRDWYKRFNPSGLVNGWVRVSRQEQGPSNFTADLSFEETTMRSDQFPLPISDISAKTIFTSDLIIVKKFSGQYGDGLISLTGQIRPGQGNEQTRFNLALDLEDTELNDDLFDTLPASTKKAVTDLKPEGRVNLNVNLNKEDITKPADCSIIVECLGNSITMPEVPYPLEDITGTLTVDAGLVKLKDVTATLGGDVPNPEYPATAKLNGQITLADNAFAGALLHLDANDILFDERFISALPQRIPILYDDASDPGRVDLDFENVRIRRISDGQRSIDFAGAVAFKKCGLIISGSRVELDSTVRTNGLYRTDKGFSSCQAALDGGAMRILGKSLTNLHTDIFYDPNSRIWSTEGLIADFYGGKLKGRLILKQPTGKAGEYVLETGFDNVDLRQFLSDTELQETPENEYTSGSMDGSLSINAGIGDISSRIGTCKLDISDMQVGKLSPLSKLINVFRLIEQKDYIFDRMLVDSYLKGNNLLVKKLDMSGQSLAFSGSGSLDLQNFNVNLALTARGKRLATDDPSVLQSLTEGLGQGVVRMEVAGNLYDPKVKTKTLPVIGKTLQIFGAKSADPNPN
ncbi:MAG: hypothetical protein ACYSW0_08410 [Planctomycetota bacterium]